MSIFLLHPIILHFCTCLLSGNRFQPGTGESGVGGKATERRRLNPTFVFSCLVKLLSSIPCRFLGRLRSFVHLFLSHPLGVLSCLRRLLLGGTEGGFSRVHHLLASIDRAGETLTNRLVNLSTAPLIIYFVFPRNI